MRFRSSGPSSLTLPFTDGHDGHQDRETREHLFGMTGAFFDPEEEEQEEEGRFRSRFPSGTGQFDLRAPEMAGVRANPQEPVSRIMGRRVVCARPDMDASEARRRMLDRGLSGMPVVDDWGRAVGMVSKTDLINHDVTSEPGRLRVRDIMMCLVFSVLPDAPISKAAALMAYEGIHRVLVVDAGGHLVGLVSALDVARWMGWGAGYPVGREP